MEQRTISDFKILLDYYNAERSVQKKIDEGLKAMTRMPAPDRNRYYDLMKAKPTLEERLKMLDKLAVIVAQKELERERKVIEDTYGKEFNSDADADFDVSSPSEFDVSSPSPSSSESSSESSEEELTPLQKEHEAIRARLLEIIHIKTDIDINAKKDIITAVYNELCAMSSEDREACFKKLEEAEDEADVWECCDYIMASAYVSVEARKPRPLPAGFVSRHGKTMVLSLASPTSVKWETPVTPKLTEQGNKFVSYMLNDVIQFTNNQVEQMPAYLRVGANADVYVSDPVSWILPKNWDDSITKFYNSIEGILEAKKVKLILIPFKTDGHIHVLAFYLDHSKKLISAYSYDTSSLEDTTKDEIKTMGEDGTFISELKKKALFIDGGGRWDITPVEIVADILEAQGDRFSCTIWTFRIIQMLSIHPDWQPATLLENIRSMITSTPIDETKNREEVKTKRKLLKIEWDMEEHIRKEAAKRDKKNRGSPPN